VAPHHRPPRQAPLRPARAHRLPTASAPINQSIKRAHRLPTASARASAAALPLAAHASAARPRALQPTAPSGVTSTSTACAQGSRKLTRKPSGCVWKLAAARAALACKQLIRAARRPGRPRGPQATRRPGALAASFVRRRTWSRGPTGTSGSSCAANDSATGGGKSGAGTPQRLSVRAPSDGATVLRPGRAARPALPPPTQQRRLSTHGRSRFLEPRDSLVVVSMCTLQYHGGLEGRFGLPGSVDAEPTPAALGPAERDLDRACGLPLSPAAAAQPSTLAVEAQPGHEQHVEAHARRQRCGVWRAGRRAHRLHANPQSITTRRGRVPFATCPCPQGSMHPTRSCRGAVGPG
jgi:hypothetical protein